jgi:hypothetical protein
MNPVIGLKSDAQASGSLATLLAHLADSRWRSESVLADFLSDEIAAFNLSKQVANGHDAMQQQVARFGE